MTEPRLLGAGAAGFILVVGLATWASGGLASLAALSKMERTSRPAAIVAPAGTSGAPAAPNDAPAGYSPGQAAALHRIYVHMNQRLGDRVRRARGERGRATLALNRG